MKTIRSNPWGFRIHSPFAYQLVTQGIYGKVAGEEILAPFPVGLTCEERKSGKLIARLIWFLQPEEVLTCGEKNSMNEWMALQFRLGKIHGRSCRSQLPFKCCRLILNSGMHNGIQQIQQDDVWVVTCLKMNENRELWNQILLLPGVTVTVESKSTGIVFFNPVFQKEHYAIKSWFYL